MGEVRSKLAACVALVDKDDLALLVQRQNTDWANGLWGVPGGIIEPGESALSAACRELREEVGVTISPEDLEFNEVVHFIQNEYDVVTFYFTCRRWKGEVRNSEPGKAFDIDWFSLDNLPDSLISHNYQVLSNIKNQKSQYVGVGMKEQGVHR